jgi:hypothetical protein
VGHRGPLFVVFLTVLLAGTPAFASAKFFFAPRGGHRFHRGFQGLPQGFHRHHPRFGGQFFFGVPPHRNFDHRFGFDRHRKFFHAPFKHDSHFFPHWWERR